MFESTRNLFNTLSTVSDSFSSSSTPLSFPLDSRQSNSIKCQSSFSRMFLRSQNQKLRRLASTQSLTEKRLATRDGFLSSGRTKIGPQSISFLIFLLSRSDILVFYQHSNLSLQSLLLKNEVNTLATQSSSRNQSGEQC